MTLTQISWIVSFTGLLLTFLIVWFIAGKMNRFGFGAYKFVIYFFLLIYAAKEGFDLQRSGAFRAANPFAWFWSVVGIISMILLIVDVRNHYKNRE
ncbi:hypothetical protein BMS3Abin05_02545 [bacterium BMS3Abin05]|nr:hypothetical protein BMS3Abin05_02545 [bacterium BMS3Abin05]GBE27720.1 hypothetical protein BMS3Bbin03_01649 [bacterium BMS3Bbin03]